MPNLIPLLLILSACAAVLAFVTRPDRPMDWDTETGLDAEHAEALCENTWRDAARRQVRELVGVETYEGDDGESDCA